LEPQRGEPFGSPLLFGVKWKGFFAHMIAKAQKAPAEKLSKRQKWKKRAATSRLSTRNDPGY
jgi:hypothetical protein